MSDHDIKTCREGISTLSYRGPDGQGEWMERGRGVYLGHRRLAIIDLSDDGAQPMTRNGLTICYNGEIYNYRELRDELTAKGCAFSTDSDTEVLLAAWEVWGSDSLNKFDGMFAFALFDGKDLHLATDSFGEKPLYWAQNKNGTYWASEPGPLIEKLGLTFAPTETESQLFLALGFIPPPFTGFPSLYQLPPATHARLTPSGLEGERRYWQMPQTRPGQGKWHHLSESDLDKVHETLVTSVQRRLRADVPVGLFLSSGVDSTLLAAIAKRDLGVDLNSLTVAFPDGQDESQAATAIARHLELPHQVIDSTRRGNNGDPLDELISIFGIPNDNLTAISVRQMSELARPRFKVALSGLGGDELFFGYNRHEWFWKKRFLYRLPEGWFKFLNLSGLSLLPRVKLAHDCLAGDRALRFLAIKNKRLGCLIKQLPAAGKFVGKEFADGDIDLVFQVRDFDINFSLSGSYIPAVERASMRAGLEVRAPFLSRPLAELLSSFDPRALVADGRKSVLRRLLSRYLPTELVDRPKQGFVYPPTRLLAALNNVDQVSVPRLLPATCKQIWEHRENYRYSTMAVRLCMLRYLWNVESVYGKDY